jgi:hypothetical protein
MKQRRRFEPAIAFIYIQGDQEPILRLRNLQLQRQRCSRLERFLKVEENIFFQNALAYP